MNIWIAVVACIACAACAANPSQPSRTILPVTGTWTGTYKVTSCTPPPYFGSCSLFTSQTYAIQLTLTQTGQSVTGMFDGEVAGTRHGRFALTGSFDELSTLRLQGSQTFIEGEFAGSEQAGIVFDNWTAVMDEAGTSMKGVFRETVEAHFYDLFYPATIAFQSQIVTLTR